MSVPEAIRAGTFYLATSHGRKRFSDPRAVVDAVGRHRLAATGAHVGSAVGGVDTRWGFAQIFVRSGVE